MFNSVDFIQCTGNCCFSPPSLVLQIALRLLMQLLSMILHRVLVLLFKGRAQGLPGEQRAVLPLPCESAACALLGQLPACPERAAAFSH